MQVGHCPGALEEPKIAWVALDESAQLSTGSLTLIAQRISQNSNVMLFPTFGMFGCLACIRTWLDGVKS